MSKQWSKEPSKRFAATGVFYTEFSLECGTVIVDPLGHETTLGYTSRAQAEYDCNVMNDAAQRLAQPQPAPVDAMREALEALVKKIEAIHDNADYQVVWTVYAFHGGRYEGPTYTTELQQARTALAAAKEKA